MQINIPEIVNWANLAEQQQSELLQRPFLPGRDTGQVVADIIRQVREAGDAALLQLGRKYDGYAATPFLVDKAELEGASRLVDTAVLAAIDAAIERVSAFHQAGVPAGIDMETAAGLRCQARYLPISPVGLYIPGGSAPLISTVIMLAIPAKTAGCEQVVMCTPPGRDGQVHPAILAAASRCGIRQVFRVGGAQAIAAMGLGTETIPVCAKLFGPGNAYVTEAKRQISAAPGGAAQDMPAGPSEVLVIADETADPTAVSWDLLAQSEHGADSQAILLSPSGELLEAVRAGLAGLAADLPRAAILAESLGHARLVEVSGIGEAVAISNRYAPEHLILNCRDAARYCEGVSTAGSVFVGPWTPESLGDYCAGPNHVLPTYGYARAYSGLSVNDYLRRMTVQTATLEGLQAAGPVAMTLANAEGLDAHKRAVAYRLEQAGAR